MSDDAAHDADATDDTDRADDRPRARRRRVVVLLLAVLVAAAIVLAVVLSVSSGRDGGTRGSGDPSDPTTSATGGTGAGASSAPSDDPSPSTTDLPAAGPDTPEAPPVGLDASPSVVEGVTVRVKSITSADGEAALPGEVSGPAVRAELELVNDSDAAIDLSSTIVNLAYGAERIPANTFATGTSAFGGTLEPGAATTGTYVFAVPADDQAVLRLTLDYAVDVPVVVFEGGAS